MMMTVGDLFKGEGTAHDPKTGQFTSSSGASYSMKEKKKDHPYENTKHTVHDADGNHVGTVVSQADGRFAEHHWGESADPRDDKTIKGPTSYRERDPASGYGYGPEKTPEQDARLETAKNVAEYHESKKGAAKALVAGDLIKRRDIAPSSLVPFVGSYEDTLRSIRATVLASAPCGEINKAVDAPAHHLDVVATFKDHAFVRCADDDVTWKVPFSYEDGALATGEPEVYTPVAAEDDEAE